MTKKTFELLARIIVNSRLYCDLNEDQYRLLKIKFINDLSINYDKFNQLKFNNYIFKLEENEFNKLNQP